LNREGCPSKLEARLRVFEALRRRRALRCKNSFARILIRTLSTSVEARVVSDIVKRRSIQFRDQATGDQASGAFLIPDT
jgi:hypothetical protein